MTIQTAPVNSNTIQEETSPNSNEIEQSNGNVPNTNQPDGNEIDNLDSQPNDPDQGEYKELKEQIEEIANGVTLITGGESVVEMRLLNFRHPEYGGPHTVSGHFDPDHFKDMATAALEWTEFADGVYFTFNPLHPDVLDRCRNQVEIVGSPSLTKKENVLYRRNMLIDVDPKRPGGVSATNAEKAAAYDVLLKVCDYLTERGWPEPLLADSGNGYHALYKIDLPVEDNGIVRSILHVLAAQFDTEAATIDRQVFNPSRLCKVYGTMARKGENQADRPHRRTAIIDCPDDYGVVPLELLEQLASEAEKNIGQSRVTRQAGGKTARSRVSDQSGSDDNDQEHARILQRAAAYLKAIPPAISGLRGHDQTFKAACALVLGFDLVVEEALDLLWEWNEECVPPWTEGELRHKLEDADKSLEERGYLINNGDDTVEEAEPEDKLATSEESNQEADKAAEILEKLNDPDRLARRFLDLQHGGAATSTLRFWRQEWYLWRDGAYRVHPIHDLEADVWRHIRAEFERDYQKRLVAWQAKQGEDRSRVKDQPRMNQVNTALRSNTIQALASRCIVPSNLDQPAWLDIDGPFPADEVLAAQNGLLHLPSFLADGSGLHPMNRHFFTTMALDYPIDLQAPPPTQWLAFLDQLWPGDANTIETLQEWFGYCLLPDTSQQKILFMIGPTRSGKGTIARVQGALLGKENVTGPTLTSLGSNFGLWPLIGKPLAVFSDARLSGRADQGVVIEKLLSISGEDTLTIDRKNREAWTGKLPTRLFLISNELPNLRDASGALVGRMILLQLTTSFAGKEDSSLLKKILPELPGILLWSLDGLHRLQERGHFAQPDSGQAALAQMGELASPIKKFVDDECVLGRDMQIVKRELYKAWAEWCKVQGYEPGNDGTFGKNLSAAFPEIKTNDRESTGSRRWRYKGIALKLNLYEQMRLGNSGTPK